MRHSKLLRVPHAALHSPFAISPPPPLHAWNGRAQRAAPGRVGADRTTVAAVGVRGGPYHGATGGRGGRGLCARSRVAARGLSVSPAGPGPAQPQPRHGPRRPPATLPDPARPPARSMPTVFWWRILGTFMAILSVRADFCQAQHSTLAAK
ncbi:collectin-12-like [Molothrus ater]|uniref:collectin-12-like n=1 Tax=Molothrus ater TaxID=84834 RepID=UPI0023E79AA0|nr:collectin-12-like [Molothrus ater]